MWNVSFFLSVVSVTCRGIMAGEMEASLPKAVEETFDPSTYFILLLGHRNQLAFPVSEFHISSERRVKAGFLHQLLSPVMKTRIAVYQG